MELVRTFMPWTLLGLACLIVVTTLLQQSDASLGSAFGGGSSTLYRTRRGFEKFLFVLTIVISIVFAGLLVFSLYLKTR